MAVGLPVEVADAVRLRALGGRAAGDATFTTGEGDVAPGDEARLEAADATDEGGLLPPLMELTMVALPMDTFERCLEAEMVLPPPPPPPPPGRGDGLRSATNDPACFLLLGLPRFSKSYPAGSMWNRLGPVRPFESPIADVGAVLPPAEEGVGGWIV